MWMPPAALVSLLTGIVGAQDAVDLLARLRQPAQRTRAEIDLRRIGAPAATWLVDALVDPDRTAPDLHAEVLAGMGTAVAAELGRIVPLVTKAPAPRRVDLLRAVANGALVCTDEAAVAAVEAALPGWIAAGFCYSEDAAAPTFAWQEYVRLVRRLRLRATVRDVGDLSEALDAVRAARAGFPGQLAGVLGGVQRVADVHDLNAFGQHGTREELEAIAELVLGLGAPARAAADELAAYLGHESPRPGVVLTESRAGIGNVAPVAMREAELPTLWRRDDWRFAAARAAFEFASEADARRLALRHLLLAPLAAERIEALAALRRQPAPWAPFAPELAACAAAADRLVAREALVAFGQAPDAGGIPLPTEHLCLLASGTDRELAALARGLLR
jgi:hypothetical protein